MKNLAAEIVRGLADACDYVGHAAARGAQQLAEVYWSLQERPIDFADGSMKCTGDCCGRATVKFEGIDEHEAPDEECRKVSEASIKEFSDVVDHVRQDPDCDFKIYRRSTVEDLEDALCGIRRAQEVLDHLRFGVKRRRPDFALDFTPDGAEAEKSKLLNRLEDLAVHPARIEEIAKDDPDFPEEILKAARRMVELKGALDDKTVRRWDIDPQIEEMVDTLYEAGVRDPYGVRSSLTGLYRKKYALRRGVAPLPVTMRTLDYDTTQRYKEGDTLYVMVQDGRTRLTTQDTGMAVGKVLVPPCEADAWLEASVNAIE